MRVPGGGASRLGVGLPGSGALLAPTTRPFGRAAGATTHWLWVRGIRAWGPVTNSTARALASWLCALWGRHEGAQGGRLLPWRGASGLGALPPPTSRPLGRAAGAHYPLAVGAGCAGVGGRHRPHSARSYELALRTVGAACGCPGWAPLAWVWGVRGQALSHPPPLVLLAVRPGPTTHWLWVRGARAWEPVTNPTARTLASWLCALWGRHEGARGGRLLPGCGASGSGALPPPTTRPFGRAAGAHYPLAVGAWCAGVGTRHRPHSARSYELALRTVGAACGCPGWAPLAWVWGVRGQALSHPPPLVLLAVRPGPTTHWLWVRGARAWEPVTNPTARTLASWLCALWGRHEGARGKRLLPGCGASGSGALPAPTTRPFGRAAGAHYPLAVGAGGAGVATRQQPHSARSCEMALRAVGAA